MLKRVNQWHAVLMGTLIVVSIPIAFVNELNSIAALLLVRGGNFLSVFEKPQREALVMAGCFAWLGTSFTFLVLPQYEHIVSRWTTPLTLGELVFMMWLLIVGANPKPLAD